MLQKAPKEPQHVSGRCLGALFGALGEPNTSILIKQLKNDCGLHSGTILDEICNTSQLIFVFWGWDLATWDVENVVLSSILPLCNDNLKNHLFS